MGFEIQKKFDYAEVSADLGASLRKHEATIRGIQSKAIYDIGEELAAARDEMSGTAGNHVGGRFYAWCESIGLKVKTVQNILHITISLGKICLTKQCSKNYLSRLCTKLLASLLLLNLSKVS